MSEDKLRELNYVDAAREGLAEEMAKDPSIFVFGEGIGARGGNFNTTVGLYDLYGPTVRSQGNLPRFPRSR